MERLCKISEPDHMAMELSECKWNSVAKPLKSLGLLEKAVTKIAGITVVRKGLARRAKLYYARNIIGQFKLKERN